MPAALRTPSTCGASMSIRASLAIRSSGRRSSIRTLTLPARSRSCASASATFRSATPTSPARRSDSFGRCSNASDRSALTSAGLQPHRQALRQVAEPRPDIEAVEPDLHRAGAALGERRGDGGRIEAAAVEGEGQPRLDIDLALRGQGAQEGHAELEVAQPMRRLQRLVDEVRRAAVDDDVVQRELRRLVALLRRRRRQARQHVVDVVAAVGEARQADHRRVDLEPVDHRREAEHPAHRDLAAQLPDLQLRRGGVARAGQGDVVDPQRQRPGIEGDVADRQAPAERLERDPLGAALERRRHDQRGRAPERRQDDDGDAGANQPAAGEEAAHAVLVRVGRAPCRWR